MSRGMIFITVEHIPTLTAKKLSKILKIIMHLYSCENMILKNILMDMEFEKPSLK